MRKTISKKVCVILLFLVTCITTIAGNTTADAYMYPPSTIIFAEAFTFLFLINFPINGIAYLTLLLGIFHFGRKEGRFGNSLSVYLFTAVVVCALATLCGAAIDLELVIPALSDSSFLHVFLPLALFLTFIVFFLLSWLLQRTRKKEATLIGIGMVIFYGVAWLWQAGGKGVEISLSTLGWAMWLIFFVLLIIFSWRYTLKEKVHVPPPSHKNLINLKAVLACGVGAILVIGYAGFITLSYEPPNFPSYIQADVEKDEEGWMINITEVGGGSARYVDLVFVIANDSDELVRIGGTAVWEGNHTYVDPLTNEQRLYYPVIIVNKSGYCLYFYATESTYPYHHFGKIVIPGDRIYVVNTTVMRSGYVLRIVGSSLSPDPGKVLYETVLL